MAAAILGAVSVEAFSQESTEWIVNDVDLWSESHNWNPVLPSDATTAIISNGGTAVLNQEQYVGHYHQLRLGVSAGQSGYVHLVAGGLEGAEARLGMAAGSSGSVLMEGGTWTNETLYVGDNGEGELKIEGGTVSNTVTVIGLASGSNGTVTVSGGTWSTVADIFVGMDGTGSLEIAGGVVDAGQYVQLGLSSGNGTLNLKGGELFAAQIKKGTGGGSVQFSGGTLKALRNQSDFLELDATVNVGGAKIDSNGFSIDIATNLSGDGHLTKDGEGTLALSGANSYAGGTVVKKGVLAVASGGEISHSNADTIVGLSSGDVAELQLNGGFVENLNTRLGVEGGAKGTLKIMDGTLTVGSDLVLGEAGEGTMILEGGEVFVQGVTRLGSQEGGSGYLTLYGGGLSTRQVVQGAGDSLITLDGGMLRATANEENFLLGNVTIGSGGSYRYGWLCHRFGTLKWHWRFEKIGQRRFDPVG